MTSPWLWYTTRATGTVALVLLTASVVCGILTATRAGNPLVPRFAVAELHRRLALLGFTFLCVHVLTAVADTYVPIGWWATVVPFTSSYRPLWIGLGAVAVDLLLVVLVTSVLRSRVGPRVFRAVHWLVYACWPVAVLHAIGAGTDLRFGWMQVLAGVCILAVLVAVGWRIAEDPHRGRATAEPRRPALDPGATRLVAGSTRPAGRSTRTSPAARTRP